MKPGCGITDKWGKEVTGDGGFNQGSIDELLRISEPLIFWLCVN